MDKLLKIAVLLTATDKMTEAITGAVSKSQRALEGLQKSKGYRAISDLGTHALVAGGAITAGFGLAVKAAEESEVATKKLDRVFKSMGDTTGKSAKQAADYASQLQYVIGVEDEQIMAVQTKLATFKHEANAYAMRTGLFNKLTKAAFDLEAAGFGDAMSNITQLGKAFEDPIKGATALKRTGTLTAAEVAKIADVARLQGPRKAQEVMLAAIERQVKGVAESSVTSTQKMKIAWSESMEAIGRAVLPTVSRLATQLSGLIQRFTEFADNNPEVIKAVGAIGVALLAFGVTIKVVTGAMTVLNTVMSLNPYVLLAAATIGIAVLIYKYWDQIKAFFVRVWNEIKRIFWVVIDWLKEWGILFIGPIGFIIKYWDQILGFFIGLWNRVKKPFLDMVAWVMNLGKEFLKAGENIVDSIVQGIKNKANAAVDAIKDVTKQIRDFFPFSPAKRGPLMDIHKVKLIETIADSVKPNALVKKMQTTTQLALNAVNKPGSGIKGRSASGGASVSLNFAPQITLSGGASKSDAENFVAQLRKYEPELVRMIKTAMDKQGRTQYT